MLTKSYQSTSLWSQTYSTFCTQNFNWRSWVCTGIFVGFHYL